MRGWTIGIAALACLAGAAGAAPGAELRAELHRTTPSGPGEKVGTVTIADSPAGAVVAPDLKDLPAGPHGFHVHEHGSCGPAANDGQTVPAGAAGGHFDPQHTGAHKGPHGGGHIGDLPVLQVAGDGTATAGLVAPQITDVSTLRGKAVVIHQGGDNYSDQPAALGGGGARIACGILQ